MIIDNKPYTRIFIMDISNLLAIVRNRPKDDGQRFGQALYNVFRETYPNVDIPEQVDCFYDDKKVHTFILYVSML
jgi:hypothetical protein